MTNTENTPRLTIQHRGRTLEARIAELHAAATVYNTGRHVPAGLRVSRCVQHGHAVAWKGATARPACPLDGSALTTTTRSLGRPFTLLEGELLTIAELMPNGLEREAGWHINRATELEERADKIEAQIAAGDLVDDPKHDGFLRSVDDEGRSSYSLVHKDTATSLRDSAINHRAKAARYRARAARLEAQR